MNKQTMKYVNVMQINGAEAAGSGVKKLARGQIDVLKRGKGSKLTCTSGSLWVTVANDPLDHILSERESFVVESNDLVLLSGIRQSSSYRVA
ncbi:MAG TPA: DUF2917 domain-containing protein [Rectinemataceae bacterium]|nr:DUF2917 domain-containing protein [Rectinemataceae bacterium]